MNIIRHYQHINLDEALKDDDTPLATITITAKDIRHMDGIIGKKSGGLRHALDLLLCRVKTTYVWYTDAGKVRRIKEHTGSTLAGPGYLKSNICRELCEVIHNEREWASPHRSEDTGELFSTKITPITDGEE